MDTILQNDLLLIDILVDVKSNYIWENFSIIIALTIMKGKMFSFEL